MTINEYLLKYPKQVEILYTKIFGNYLLRYYDINDYSVIFSHYAETSYQDEKNKQIVISLNNVIHMLESGVNVLAVAYHEMAHTIYTSNATRDDIQKKTIKILSAQYDDDVIRLIHNLWNILEDHIIETKLMQEYPFLTSIVAPLKTIIDDDNALLSWRKGTTLPSDRQDIDEYATRYTTKKISNKAKAEILAYIYQKYYQQDKSSQEKVNGSEKIREKLSATENIKERQERIDESKEQLEKEIEDWLADAHKDAIERNERIIDTIKQEFQDKYDEELELEQDVDDGLTELERISRIETTNEQEKLFKDVLFKEQKIIEEKQELKTYNESVDNVLESAKKQQNDLQHYKILDVYSAKQRVRNGMSQALTKKYSFDVSPKLSVSRLVSSKANKTIPNIFQNKGKDVNFLKKVVIFEDVSGSTLSSRIHHTFSQIAKGLATSFESVEWWGYSDRLWLKPKNLYNYETLRVGNHLGVSSASGTSAYKLLNVMKKYKKQDNTYIIITDGDMHNVFDHKELWNYFKDRTCVIGLLDDTIKENAPHYVEIRDTIDAMVQTRKLYKENSDNYEKIMIKAGSFAIKKAIQMVESRIR
jgi:hypothetical protein